MIYLDHAATTPVDEAVLQAMLPYLCTCCGNPSSLYRLGRQARQALDDARERVARFLNAEPREVVFTSGGTESDNLAIRGVAYARRAQGRHLITTRIEHHAVLHTCQALEQEGFEVTYLPVERDGRVTVEAVRAALRPDTILISVMAANNEMGALQPVAEIGRLARERDVTFHTDAVQAVGQIPLDVNQWQVDLLSVSGHKVYAPKGIGCLYVRQGTPLTPQITGGGQERNRRSGTENVAGAVALAQALDLAHARLVTTTPRIQALRDRLIAGLLERLPNAILNGPRDQRLPNNVSVCIPDVEAEQLLLQLDLHDIAASSGSACASGALHLSHVLLAMGVERRLARGALRLTLGKDNTPEQIETVLDVLPHIVAKLTQWEEAEFWNPLSV